MPAHDQTALPRRAESIDRETIVRLLRRPAPRARGREPQLSSPPEDGRVTAAAVLIPLIGRNRGIQVLLTQRTEHLDAHAGQICFPGGRVEREDASREETALRETEEEIGLDRGRIVPLGRLPDHEMPSGFRITPVVGWIEPPFELKLDPFEVAGAFEVPLAHFLEESNFQRREYDFRGRHRHYLAVPYEGRYIWGATAAMLYSLCCALAGD